MVSRVQNWEEILCKYESIAMNFKSKTFVTKMSLNQ